MTEEDWQHRIMVLKTEITCGNAITRVLKEKVDHLEEGLNQARAEIARLRELRQKAETAASPTEAD